MWNWLNRNVTRDCYEYCELLERTANPDHAAKTNAAVFSSIPAKLREHAASCESCRTFADDILQVRAIFAEAGNRTQPSPYFLARVMATIADREFQLQTAAQTWAAVPRLASRLTVLASLGLLIAASWVYEMPKTSKSSTIASSGQAAEGLVDAGSVQDDLLVSAR